MISQNCSKTICIFISLFLISEVGAAEAVENLSKSALQTQMLSPSPLSNSIWQMALGLGLVLAIIFILAWLMRRVSGVQNSKAHIKILSAVNVGTKERAVLIEVGKDQLLLGVASGQVSLLHKLETPVVDQPGNFSKSLKMASIKLSQQSDVSEKNKSD